MPRKNSGLGQSSYTSSSSSVESAVYLGADHERTQMHILMM